MNIPMPGKTMIRPFYRNQESDGGIILADVTRGLEPMGVVLAVTPKRYETGVYVHPGYEVDDTVLYNWTAASVLEYDKDDSLVVINNDDVMCVYEG